MGEQQTHAANVERYLELLQILDKDEVSGFIILSWDDRDECEAEFNDLCEWLDDHRKDLSANLKWRIKDELDRLWNAPYAGDAR